jgi:prophage maintenance system killer protein
MYAAGYLLEKLDYELQASQQELEDFAVSIAEDSIQAERIALWFEEHTHKG